MNEGEINKIPANEVGNNPDEALELSFDVANTEEELYDMLEKMGYVDGMPAEVVINAIKAGDFDSVPNVFDLKAVAKKVYGVKTPNPDIKAA